MQIRIRWHELSWLGEVNFTGHCASCARLRLPELRGHLHRRDFHCRQAGKQERCRKPLPIDLAVNLVWRFVNAVRLQQTRQLLVSHASLCHLRNQQFLCPVLPWRIGDLPTQFQRPGNDFWGRCRLAHWALDCRKAEGKKFQIGHIRPNRHFSVGTVPTRPHQPLL